MDSIWKNIGSVMILFSLGACANLNDVVPTFTEDSMKSAEKAQQKGDLPTAIKGYRQAIKQDPNNREAYLKLGYALLDSNYANEAYKVFKDAQQKFKKCPSSYRGMGAVLLVMDRPDEAAQYFNHALELNAHDAKAINDQGIAYELLGDMEKAQVSFQAAMEMDPSQVNYESNYALSLALNGQPQEGIRILERLARVPDASPRIRQNLALAYGLAGDMPKSRHVGRMDLSDAMVKNNLSYIQTVKHMSPQSSRFANVLPTHQDGLPLDSARSWHER